MQFDNRKISVRQLLIIVVVAAFVPMIQVVPQLVGGIAGRVGWLSILVAFGLFALLILMLARMFRKTEATDLYELFTKIVGKFCAKVIIAIYGIWTFVLIAFYARSFAERFVASILPNTPISVFLAILLAVAAVFAYGKLESFARFAELSLYLFAGVFVFLLAVSLPTIEVQNLLPITARDGVPALWGAVMMLGFLSYLTFGLFLGDGVSDMAKFRKQGIKSGILLAVAGLITFVVTVGILGVSWASEANLPFFTAVRTVRLLNVVERLEALFLTFWVIADLVIVSLFLYVFLNILRKLFALKNPKRLTAPTVLGVYLLSGVIAGNLFELSRFFERVAVQVNVALGVGVPILIFVVAILRKKV